MFFSEIYGLFGEQDLVAADIQTRNYAIIILCIGIAGGLCQCLSSIAFSKSGEALTMRMRSISFASMLRQEIGWFDREQNKVGALVTQLSSDTSSLKVRTNDWIETNRYRNISLYSGFIRCSNRYYIQCCRCNNMRINHCIHC